ncbi:MAG: DUF5615 family PIN-like protein [Actinomycetota bacterium]|nr:DUF5615 family PIN-like protein [Actinomycetota bacterium]
MADLRGMSDGDLLAYATASGRAVVTENIVDFAPLTTQWATENRPHAGLIYTNPKRFNRATLTYPGNLINALLPFLDNPPIDGESWTWWHQQKVPADHLLAKGCGRQGILPVGATGIEPVTFGVSRQLVTNSTSLGKS